MPGPPKPARISNSLPSIAPRCNPVSSPPLKLPFRRNASFALVDADCAAMAGISAALVSGNSFPGCSRAVTARRSNPCLRCCSCRGAAAALGWSSRFHATGAAPAKISISRELPWNPGIWISTFHSPALSLSNR